MVRFVPGNSREPRAILGDLRVECEAFAGRAVPMRVKLEIDPTRGELSNFVRLHDVQKASRSKRLEIDAEKVGKRSKPLILFFASELLLCRVTQYAEMCLPSSGGVEEIERSQARDKAFERNSISSSLPKEVRYHDIEHWPLEIRIVGRLIHGRRDAELTQNGIRAREKIVRPVVEREADGRLRKGSLAQSPNSLVQRQDCISAPGEQLQSSSQKVLRHVQERVPLVLVIERNAVVAKDQ